MFFGRPKPDVDGKEARALVEEEGATLLDVRTAAEFSGGHLPNAINIPVAELGSRLEELKGDRGRPIVVYCQSGMRSAQAKKELQRNGFEHVHDLGGRHRW
ncbi:MAG TPA: rhodanese-like domain-containing protein [Polyangiaceae bacterium]|nr:rhodanese-like domain-containing protein [Polyangiaceae bacterium]